MRELRCANKLHGVVVGDRVVEIKCDSKFCGAGKGAVVLHRFLIKGDGTTLIDTKRYKTPLKGGT